jgi:hypothetical protein
MSAFAAGVLLGMSALAPSRHGPPDRAPGLAPPDRGSPGLASTAYGPGTDSGVVARLGAT